MGYIVLRKDWEESEAQESMKEFIRQVRLWRIRRRITKALRHIQAAQSMRVARFPCLVKAEENLRLARRLHNP